MQQDLPVPTPTTQYTDPGLAAPQMENGNRNEVEIQIEEMLENAQPPYTTKCSIYRVPPQIRETNQAAYTPKVVSVGPLHHEDTKLLAMEAHKQLYCQKFIDRSEVGLDALVSCVREREPKVRECYSDNIELSTDELVKVILVDSGFIIELFIRFYSREWNQFNDAILLTPWLIHRIRIDLLLLENQIPFFILEKLYNLAFESRINEYPDWPSLCDLAKTVFSNFIIGGCLASSRRIKHFTDLFRTSHLQPSDKQSPRRDGTLNLLHNATELNEAGVKFRENDPSQSILDLQFSGGNLKISPIKVFDETEILLRNMIALEQCLYPGETYIADYTLFMDFLINTDKDVDVLIKRGIIVNWLDDNKEVAEMFNGLGKNILLIDCNANYLEICDKLLAYCKHPRHRLMATLKRDYCNTPWKKVVSIAGIAVVIFTLIQTICSILK